MTWHDIHCLSFTHGLCECKNGKHLPVEDLQVGWELCLHDTVSPVHAVSIVLQAKWHADPGDPAVNGFQH